MKATNNYIWLIRDPVDKEKDGLILANTGRVKPHTGTIVSVGSLVKDQEIKRNRHGKAMFHPTVGFEIEHEGVVYLICTGEEIICLP